MKPSIYETIKAALVERGWKIDESAVENRMGEKNEFLHPETGRAFAWIDAVLVQHEQFDSE